MCLGTRGLERLLLYRRISFAGHSLDAKGTVNCVKKKLHFVSWHLKYIFRWKWNKLKFSPITSPLKALSLSKSWAKGSRTVSQLCWHPITCVVSAFCIYQLHSCTSTWTTWDFQKKTGLKSDLKFFKDGKQRNTIITIKSHFFCLMAGYITIKYSQGRKQCTQTPEQCRLFMFPRKHKDSISPFTLLGVAGRESH